MPVAVSRGTLANLRGTIVTDHASGTPVVRTYRLVVSDGPDQGKEHVLELGTTLVGSHPSTDFVLTDPRVSRRHCELRVVADGVQVRDLGSKNGIFVGRVKVEQAVLLPGAKLRLGDTKIAVHNLDASVEVGDLATFGDLRTESPAMKSVFGLLSRASTSDATILLEGETGVGKDVLARTIHAQSHRAKGPLVVFDCSAVSESLIAGELFGHKKGAFTGATTDRAGVFEEAAGGTVFLDEVGELSLDLQPMLLRALENRQVRRVGEAKSRDIDVRVVAATNRDLMAEVKAGRFRQDLFYRLAIVKVSVPPLRERKADLPLLAKVLLERLGLSGDVLTRSDMRALTAYDWPGNVRELKNMLEQSMALSDEHEFVLLGPRGANEPGPPTAVDEDGDDDDFGEGENTMTGVGGPLDVKKPYKEAREDVLRSFEQRYIESLLKAHDGNVSAAARAAGIDRNYVYRLMKRFGIEKP